MQETITWVRIDDENIKPPRRFTDFLVRYGTERGGFFVGQAYCDYPEFLDCISEEPFTNVTHWAEMPKGPTND